MKRMHESAAGRNPVRIRHARDGLLGVLLGLLLLSAMKGASPGAEEFHNPILAGFYPDPSICKVGPDYYLVTSTFSYFPGIPVMHSRDLVHWRLIGHVMSRPEQLTLDKQGVSRGIFAPAIRYHNGVFYLTCTLVDIGGNFVVTSRDPQGPWSDPVWLPEVDGIDPSLFFDDDGSAYLIYNSIPPDGKSLYDGHRTLRMYPFDAESLKVKGREQILVNGGTDITQKPVWIEAPHIFKKDGLYYLIAAEGGTADRHSEVVFRSARVNGPYISYDKNPILTQRHLDPGRQFPITSTGHADFVETDTGDWWAVFLGCRPYAPFAEGFYNTGRETFLAPVSWESGWPVINPGEEKVRYSYPAPIQSQQGIAGIPQSGNFTTRDEFNSDLLDPNWCFLRTPHTQWYTIAAPAGTLSMRVRPETCSGSGNPSFLARRQQHLQGSATVAMRFRPETDNEKVGITIFQNETHYYFLCRSREGNAAVVQLLASGRDTSAASSMNLIASRTIPEEFHDKTLYLRIEAEGNVYSFLYAFVPGEWKLVRDNVDATFLSTKIAGGFVGCMYALYATSLGEPSSNQAEFEWFEYTGDDQVYR